MSNRINIRLSIYQKFELVARAVFWIITSTCLLVLTDKLLEIL
jgi:hypothetical protein